MNPTDSQKEIVRKVSRGEIRISEAAKKCGISYGTMLEWYKKYLRADCNFDNLDFPTPRMKKRHVLSEFGRMLELRGIKNSTLAARLGVHSTSVSAWRLGKYSPQISQIPSIARFLGEKPETVFKMFNPERKEAFENFHNGGDAEAAAIYTDTSDETDDAEKQDEPKITNFDDAVRIEIAGYVVTVSKQ